MPTPTTPPSASAVAFKIGWLSLFSVALVRTAWVSDDAYFTFRTIDNLVHGYGLRWNVAERVQAYTHPLWMWLVALFYAFTGEAYFTSLAISATLTLATLWLLVRLAPSLWSATVGLTVLLLCRAFLDYSTSGLENPLTNVLLVLFFGCYVSSIRRPFLPALLAGLLMLNRLDLVLLVFPALVVMRPRTGRVRDSLVFAAGFLPLLVWELFALLYYGFPFPNTAYAKLKTGIPEPELIRQGFIYLIDSVQRDPLTLLAIISTAAWSLVENPRRTRPIALGVLCYVAYVTWVGGDFMSGRMLEAPLLAAVIVLIVADVSALTEPRWALIVFAGVVGVNASQAAFGPRLAQPNEALGGSGVADERLYWFADNGLMNYTRDVPWPKPSRNGLQARTEGPRVVVNIANGVLGYFAGPRLHIVDITGLGDPLLARLPALSPWRIGHFERAVPLGYGDPETAATEMIGPKMAAYYQRLSLITKGPLWDSKRLATIVQMNVGRYDDLLHEAATEATYSVHPTYRTGDRVPARGAGRWQCSTTRDAKPLTAGDLLPACPGDWIWLGR